MKQIKIKTPAKINLTLEVLNKRQDGFHNIKSIMQTVSLYDYLTFKIEKSNTLEIILNGNNNEIPYDETNLVYKTIKKFFEITKLPSHKISVYIEKNIPVSAGLAGGSSNSAGTVIALNKLFNSPLDDNKINELCALLGSDINFCCFGGCRLCSSKGERTEKLPFLELPVSLIKPKNIGISAKEAYTKFSLLKDKSVPNNTDKLCSLLEQGKFDEKLLYNNLENAVLPYYPQLKMLKEKLNNSLMSGSGSTFFVLSDKIEVQFDENKYDIFENLKTVPFGVIEC